MGTYSGYAEHFDGWAFAVEINIGAHSDPGHEIEVLRERQQTIASLIAPLREPLRRAVEHFRSSAHAFRRYAALLDGAARDYEGPAPEPLWSSEARSRGARIPIELLGLPEPDPEPGDAPLSLVARPELPERVDLYLYLATADVPYRLREVIDGHLVASQLAAGGLFEAGRRAVIDAPLEQVLQDAWDGVNRHSPCRLLHVVADQADAVAALAHDEPAGSPVGTIARVCAGLLDSRRITPELIAEAARHRHAFTLLAMLANDEAWARHAAEFAAVDAELSAS